MTVHAIVEPERSSSNEAYTEIICLLLIVTVRIWIILAYVFSNALQAVLTLRYPLIMDHFVKKLLATEKHSAITRYLIVLLFSS
jgi:hypothetical protein